MYTYTRVPCVICWHVTKVFKSKKCFLVQLIKITHFQPDVIIHAAAERRPDAVEQKQEATHALNVEATSNICKLAGIYYF